MAFFPREFYTPAGSSTGFHPLFRLLDDFDTYSRQGGSNGHHRKSRLQNFQAKFDVRELEDAFELHGELAGLNKQDVHIEFTEPQTMIIRGRIERAYQSGTPPATAEDTQMSGAIAEDGYEEVKNNDHHATVEDTVDEETSTTAEATPTTTVAETAKPEKEEKVAPKAKFWVSERSIGEFSRTFNFPGRIDQDNVSAKLEDGILTVRVPKAPKHEARRINIA